MTDVLAATGGGLADLVVAAHDRQLNFALRSEPLFRAVADTKPVLQTSPGSSVNFYFIAELSVATSTLDEDSDVDRVDSTETAVNVSVAEYGNAVGTTAKLRATGLFDFEAAQSDLIAFNARDSIDVVVRDVLSGGDNVRYSGGASDGTTNPLDLYDSTDVRYVTAKLRGNKAQPRKGSSYVSFIHPDVSHDLQAEAGDNGSWREAHVYASPDALYAGEIGMYQGQVFVETPRAKLEANAGSSPTTTDVYHTITVGREALAEAVAIEPHVVQSPVVDRLRRFSGLGWYALIGWKIFRQASLYRVESASSIGANS